MTTRLKHNPPLKALYTFEWIGGGYNQVYATSRTEARNEIEVKFHTCGLSPNLKSLQRLGAKQEEAYWKTFECGGSRWTD